MVNSEAETQDNLIDIMPNKTEIFGLTGVISKVILNIDEHPENSVMLNHLKAFLVAFSLPQNLLKKYSHLDSIEMLTSALIEYKSNAANYIYTTYPSEIASYLVDAVSLIDEDIFSPESRPFFSLIGNIVKKVKCNNQIQIYEEADLVFIESMYDKSEKLALEIQNQVNIYGGKKVMRSTLVNPEIYWLTSSVDKLKNIAMVVLEELLHLTQREPNKVTIHTLGYTFKNTDGYDEILQDFLGRMMETDVTNILTTALPQIKKEDWQWYTERQKDKPHEKHFPLRVDYLWMFGWIIATLTDQIPQFLVASMTELPEYLNKDSKNIEDFFSKKQLVGILLPYSELLFVHESDDEEIVEEIERLRKQSMSRGIFDIFLSHCFNLKRQKGANWQDFVGEGSEYTQELLENILNHYKKNPTEYRDLVQKYGGASHFWEIRFWKRKRLTPDQMFGVLLESFSQSGS